MNGWQRLFLVFAVISVLPGLALWIASSPKEADSHFAPECQDAGDSLLTKDEAIDLLRRFQGKVVSSSLRSEGPWNQYQNAGEPVMWSDCAADLRSFISGEKLRDRRSEWHQLLLYGAVFYAVFLGIIYALGWSLGWIWRGFFPPKGNPK